MSETSEQKGQAKHNPKRTAQRWLAFVVIAFSLSFIIDRFVLDLGVSASPAESQPEFEHEGTDTKVLIDSNTDFSKFAHDSGAHSRLPCLLCHRRDTNATQPKFSGHTPCTGCHAQEFANSGSPICTICHANGQSGVFKSFPKLKSFYVKFDHARHIGAGRNSSQCSMCHRPERRGVSLSIPMGLGGHATCFQCHTERALGRSGQDIASCGTCHSPGGYSRTTEYTRAFKIGFSHAKHGAGKKLSCSACHSIRAGMPQRRQVTFPALFMHTPSGRAQACSSCHDDKRAFGIANPSECMRCHQGKTWRM